MPFEDRVERGLGPAPAELGERGDDFDLEVSGHDRGEPVGQLRQVRDQRAAA